MPIQVCCEKCGRQAEFPDIAAGRNARCKCGQTITVTAESKFDGFVIIDPDAPLSSIHAAAEPALLELSKPEPRVLQVIADTAVSVAKRLSLAACSVTNLLISFSLTMRKSKALWRIAACAVLLVIGFLIGRYSQTNQGSNQPNDSQQAAHQNTAELEKKRADWEYQQRLNRAMSMFTFNSCGLDKFRQGIICDHAMRRYGSQYQEAIEILIQIDRRIPGSLNRLFTEQSKGAIYRLVMAHETLKEMTAGQGDVYIAIWKEMNERSKN